MTSLANRSDNPRGYGDGEDPRKYDPRLRGPVSEEELAIDPETGMANYIANEKGGWSTSSGYVKWSFARSLHFGRMYTHGANKGREEDLCEALRCLGQGLHTLEDFPAHSQYVQLSLRELGFTNVFPHVGSRTMMNVRGKTFFPLVTGTFGSIDFLLSVMGEAGDHVTQSQVEEMEKALDNSTKARSQAGADQLVGLLSQVPGTRDLCQEAQDLQASSERDAQGISTDRAFGMGDIQNLAKTDPQAVVKKIYPILVFRDKIVRTIDGIVSKIPGLEAIIEKITETVTLFVMRLLAPYIIPLISLASKGLKQGTTGVVNANASKQFEVFDDPHSLAPSHSILSHDHFSNLLNEPAGKVACAIVRYVAPRIVYGWDHPEVPEHEILNDICQVLHHPALRNEQCEVHREMFKVVSDWSHQAQREGKDLNHLLSAESVRSAANHHTEEAPQGFAAWTNIPNLLQGQKREIDLDSDGPGPGLPPRQDYDQQQHQQQYGGYGQQQPQSNYSRQQPQSSYGQQQPQQPYGQAYGYPNQPQPGIPDPWANNGNPQLQGPYQGQPPPEAYNQPPPQQAPPPGQGYEQYGNQGYAGYPGQNGGQQGWYR